MRLGFTVLGVAAPQGSFRAMISKGTGKAFLQQSSKRTMPWRQEVAAVAADACEGAEGAWPVNGPVGLRVSFFLPRPTGHAGKRGLRPSAPRFPATKPDLSKLVRAIEDALTGIVFSDDARIVWQRVEKLYADDGVAPHAEVEIEVLPEKIGCG